MSCYSAIHTHARAQTGIHTRREHTCVNQHLESANIRTPTPTHRPADPPTHTHTPTHTRTIAYKHAHNQTHTHTDTQSESQTHTHQVLEAEDDLSGVELANVVAEVAVAVDVREHLSAVDVLQCKEQVLAVLWVIA